MNILFNENGNQDLPLNAEFGPSHICFHSSNNRSLANIIPEISTIILDYCASTVCARVFDSKKWYDKLSREFHQIIRPIAPTINLNANKKNREAYCLSIAAQIQKFVEIANLTPVFDKSDQSFIVDDLDIIPLVNAIKGTINQDLCNIFENTLFTISLTLVDLFENILKEKDINIKSNEIRKLLKSLKAQKIDKLNNLKNIELNSMNLKTIPIEISYFVNLESINLNYNCIQKIPNCLRKLKHLKALDIENNHLRSIPKFLLNFSKLQTLSLSGNKIEYLPKFICHFINLDCLFLSDNLLKQIPDSIGRLIQLRTITFDNNRLETIPETIGNLINLQEIHFRPNPLKKLPYGFHKLYDNQVTIFGITDDEHVGLLEQISKESKEHKS